MEPERIGELIDRLAAPLELYARQWCDVPEDVVQEAFVMLSTRTLTPDNPAAWLFKAVRHRAINAGIADRRRRRREAKAASSWFEPEIPSHHDDTVDPDSAQAALSTLPVEQREVVVAHLWGGLTFGEIAKLAGTSASSAHRLYTAALTTLRGRLGVPCRTNTPRPDPR